MPTTFRPYEPDQLLPLAPEWNLVYLALNIRQLQALPAV